MTLTLSQRIKAAEARRTADLRYLHPSKPVPFTPRWLRRLEPKDFTSDVLVNGAFTPAGSERGA